MKKMKKDDAISSRKASLREAQELSEENNLHRAVLATISAGYQLNKEAFEFLSEISRVKDPLSLMEISLKRIELMSERPLFINRDFLEEIVKEDTSKDAEELDKLTQLVSSPPITGTKKAFTTHAKDFDADIEVIDDPTEEICSTGSIEEYLQYFQDRFVRIKRILKRRMDVHGDVSISEALENSVNSKVKVIGMITKKRETNQGIFLNLEDLKATITVMVPQNVDRTMRGKARGILLDQVICVSAVKGKNDLLIAKDVIWPDIPQKIPKKAPRRVYAALISDLHVGSKMFMEKEFSRFIMWLNGKFGNERYKNVASYVKYVVIAGDLVDGIGVYPNQLNELSTEDIHEQYQLVSRFIEKIPDYIEIIVIPGNHDAVRKALPQPAIPQKYAEPMHEARKIYSLGNPCTVSLHGVELLLYHGRSLDDVAATSANITFQRPDKTMKTLLQCRHLAPIYGERTPIAPEKKDFMVIERVPDIFHAGHVHVIQADTYRGTLLVNSGAWQNQTEYQRKMGLFPMPGIAPIVNLQTLQVTPLSFKSTYPS